MRPFIRKDALVAVWGRCSDRRGQRFAGIVQANLNTMLQDRP